MNSNLIMKLARGLFAGFYALCVSIVIADDTEIYLGNAAASGSTVAPNILFVLDTSGSMDREVEGTGLSRLDNMKGALRTLISGTNNVNMGLMRFVRPGGAVLYPVSYIDDLAGVTSDGQVNVNVRIATASDDALQHDSGVVELDSQVINLTEFDFGDAATAGTVDIPISSDNNDAEQNAPSGSVDRTSSDLEITKDGSDEQLIGLRFTDIPLTKASNVTEAKITFFDDNDGNTDSVDLRVNVQGEKGGDTGDFQANDIASRTRTSARANWNVGDFDDDELNTRDLSSVVNEVIGADGWNSGDPLTFILERRNGDGIRVARSYRNAHEDDEQPFLSLTYDGGSTGTENQMVGMRFQEVGIPKGATITSATIEFVTKQTSSDVTSLSITAENTGNASEFEATANNLGVLNRPRTGSSATWTPAAWDTVGEIEQSVDISSLVQDVVNHADWCGNNAMAFFIEGTGRRFAESFDSNSSSAPYLKINYDPNTVPAATCFNREYSYRVSNNSDDAEEDSGGDMDLTSSDLELVKDGSTTQQVGIRFNAVQIPQGSVVQSAYLEFTVDEDDSGSTSVTIYGHDTDNSPTFQENSDKVSTRTKTTANVAWNSIPAWVEDETHRSPDITDIVQEIIDRGGWSEGNGMSFIITGSGERTAESVDGSSGEAPRLVVQVRSTSSSAGVKTVREELIQIVDDLQYAGGTPIVDAFYEGVRYYRGETMDYGAQRGLDEPSRQQHMRVSHSDSWVQSEGTLVREVGCTDSNLSASACKSENITGSPRYISPITDSCQQNHLVILTDGSASVNESEAKVKSLTGVSSCVDSGDEACGPELANWIKTVDQGSIDGAQTITTHAIGFNFTGDWIKSVASNGGGGFYEADTADQLALAFETIVAEALKTNSTFASPTAAINQFNRLNHLNDIYFAVFRPTEEAVWDGNVKRYQLSGPNNDIVDANGAIAVDDDTAFFKTTSQSFWSSSVDGSTVAEGGAAENLPAYDAPRKTYTYTGTDLDLTDSSNAIHGTPSSAITKAMLGASSMSDELRENLLAWIAGKDVLDEDGDPSTTTRYSMGDPLHSKPIVYTHGGTSASPSSALLFGTNDGHFRAIDVSTGVQLWSFIPPELLPVSKELYENTSSVHPYGVDGASVLWVNDPGFDGTEIDLTDTDDFAYVYFGLRRGGRNYHALDVTDINNPKYLWEITGGSGDFVELGQSWSRPVKTRISVKSGSTTTETDVLIFSGGYDEDQDDTTTRTPDSMGRALYIVNAKTGALIWKADISSYSDMKYSIPASPAVADINNDGLADQIYIGDVGGQVWRFDINNGSLIDDLMSGGVIAELATDGSEANTRRFYHTPDLSLLTDSAGDQFIGVFIGSGFHAHPLDTSVTDRFYMIEQADVYEAPASYSAVTESDLYDATDNDLLEGTSAERLAAQAGLDDKQGWYITFTNTGEKVLSTPLNIDGKVVFTTYEPTPSTVGCTIQPGTSREYVLVAKNAAPALDLGGVIGGDLTTDDRSRTLETGSIVDEPVIIFTEEGGGSTFLGTTKGSLSIGTDRIIRTFWYQE